VGARDPLRRHATDILPKANFSPAADRALAASYVSLRRTPAHIRKTVHLRLRICHRDQDPRDGFVLEGCTQDIDTMGMIAEVKLPDLRWLRGLLTSEILCRVEVDLPEDRGRFSARAVVAWAEAFHLGDPCRLGMAFIQVDDADSRKLIHFVRECQTTRLLRPA